MQRATAHKAGPRGRAEAASVTRVQQRNLRPNPTVDHFNPFVTADPASTQNQSEPRLKSTGTDLRGPQELLKLHMETL